MKIYQTKKVMREERLAVGAKCDICKKDILGRTLYGVTTGHNDWGNDSIDSIEDADVCSDECLKAAFQAYLDDKDYGSKYIKIEMEG